MLAACWNPLETVSTVIKQTTSSLVASGIGSGAGAGTVTSRTDSGWLLKAMCPKKSLVNTDTALESMPIVATAVPKSPRVGLSNCSCESADVWSYMKKVHNHSPYLVHTSPYQRQSQLGWAPNRIVCLRLARMKSRGGCPRRGLPIVDGGGLPRSDLGRTSAVAPYRPC